MFDFQAVDEEKALYERSTRRQVYLNLCVNAIKKLRDVTQLESPSPVTTETATPVAVTKMLSSGAVLVSTKSPVKQEKPVSPTEQLTGGCYDNNNIIVIIDKLVVYIYAHLILCPLFNIEFLIFNLSYIYQTHIQRTTY